MRVLIVDDLPLNRKLLRAILNSAGHESVEAGDGREALEALQRGAFDVVVTDVLMPGMDGYRLCSEMRRREEFRGIPIVMYTSTYTSPADEKMAMRVGADRFVRKPSPPAEILGVLDSVTSSPRPTALGEPLEDVETIREYSEVLVRKLEEKNLALESSERRIRDLVAFAPIGICQSTPGGILTSANSAIAAMLGYESPEELLDLNISRDVYFDPAARAEAASRLDRGEREVEVQWKRKDDSPIWVQLDRRTAEDESGRPTHHETFVRDVSARKRAEAESESSMAQSTAGHRRKVIIDIVLMAVLAGIGSYLDNRYDLFETAFKWMQAHEPGPYDEIAAALFVLSVLGCIFSFRRWRDMRSEMRVREGTERALRLLRADLENRVEARTAELQADIAQRNLAEKAARASEQRVRALMENANDAIYVSSLEGVILEVNRAAERLQGRPRSEIVGSSVADVVVPEERERVGRSMAATISEGHVAGLETLSLRSDGTRVPVEVSASVVEVGDEKLIHAIVRDVSERKGLEEQYRQAQKMEAVGRLAGGIAHDFNNLLMVIQSFADILPLHLGDENAVRNDIEQLRSTANRGAGLTRQLLAFSRKQVVKAEVVDAGRIAAEIAALLEKLIGEDVRLEIRLDTKDCFVRGDRGQLEQVLMNLAVNARDAMPRGGQILIDVQRAELDERFAATHAGVKPGSFVQMSVSDTGTGMDAEVRKHLFEPFFTTKENGRGTGLGLATVYGIVKSAGGDVWVYSEPGKGSVFKIYLPRVERAGTVATAEPIAASDARGKETIFLVEDEDVIRDMVKEYLESKGYRVHSARDGHDAIRQGSVLREPIDLLLTDIVLPGPNGREVSEALFRLRPAMKTIFMSGYIDDAQTVHQILSEGRDFIQKPIGLEPLARKIREILDR
jgi:PAS domain S-box-containing protein